MSDKTGIQWTDATWNPVRGCTRVSEGCRNCYAEKWATRFSGPGAPYEGLVTSKGRWSGTIKLVPDKLDQPLRWTKPRMVFVNSMSDLFHEGVPFEYVAAVFGVMAASPRHTFQVLTKRPERAREFFEWVQSRPYIDGLKRPVGGVRSASWVCEDAARDAIGQFPALLPSSWPLPNVWLGVSVEDQATADERIPILLQLPAAVRWVSYEPALGPVDFAPAERVENGLDWIVVGGESGPGARPFDVDWARRVIRDSAASGVPVFVKQLGANVHARATCEWEENLDPRVYLKDRKGGDWDEWPQDLRVREWPKAAT